MNNELKDIFHIQEVLKANGYHDISRISNEIYRYSTDNSSSLEDILKRISNSEPWEYIKGECEFRDRSFKVNQYTLIPRIESEQIVDIVKNAIQNSPIPFTTIVDVGTGSGCLIISIAEELGSKYSYYATDISEDALSVAKQNAESSLHIQFMNTNLIQDLELNPDGYHFIIANLPYIPTSQYLELGRSVKDFEPRDALDGGKNGTKYCFELIQQIKAKNIKGLLLLEIEPSTKNQFEKFSPVIIKDIYGRERFLLISLC